MKNLSKKNSSNSLSTFKTFQINKLQQYCVKGGNNGRDESSGEDNGAVIIIADIVDAD